VKVENNNKPGKSSQHIGLTIEKDLVVRIDQLAKRDLITRSTWMREALISAWKRGAEFKRTPLHGYLDGPAEILPNNDPHIHGGAGGINPPPSLQQTV